MKRGRGSRVEPGADGVTGAMGHHAVPQRWDTSVLNPPRRYSPIRTHVLVFRECTFRRGARTALHFRSGRWIDAIHAFVPVCPLNVLSGKVDAPGKPAADTRRRIQNRRRQVNKSRENTRR